MHIYINHLKPSHKIFYEEKPYEGLWNKQHIPPTEYYAAVFFLRFSVYLYEMFWVILKFLKIKVPSNMYHHMQPLL